MPFKISMKVGNTLKGSEVPSKRRLAKSAKLDEKLAKTRRIVAKLYAHLKEAHFNFSVACRTMTDGPFAETKELL